MKKSLLLSSLFIASLALSGCIQDKAPKTVTVSQGTAATVSANPIPAVTSQVFAPRSQKIEQAFTVIDDVVGGFKVGPAASKAKAYVFFDTQCPHCAVLWDAAKPLANEVEFVWVPVAFMNRASRSQGATIIGAEDPSARMSENEAMVVAGRSGITADSSLVKRYGNNVDKNTEFFNSFRAPNDGVPFIVTKVDGTYRQVSGSMGTARLRTFLGLATN